MNWTIWLKGLVAVAIGGAATGAVSAISAGELNKNAAVTACIGALSTVLAYLAKSPLAVPAANQPAEVQTGALPTAGASDAA